MNSIILTLRELWFRLLPYLRNKYILTITLLFLWLTFLDQNNFISRVRMIREVHQLRDECEYYSEKILTDSVRLGELQSSPDMLEKYAREQYLMKKDNEEIFVIVNR